MSQRAGVQAHRIALAGRTPAAKEWTPSLVTVSDTAEALTAAMDLFDVLSTRTADALGMDQFEGSKGSERGNFHSRED